MKNKLLLPLIFLAFSLGGCTDFLDIVPDGVARLETAFNRRTEAKKFLYTCYSFMPKHGEIGSDAALWGDELWTLENSATAAIKFGYDAFNIERGLQNSTNPLVNHWYHYYRAISDCNIFIENVVTVPDLPDWEKKQWLAEAKVLKAYYHFMLICQYGPIPLNRKNLPIDADEETVSVFREPVDECFAYVVQLLDEAKGDLPEKVINEYEELGRITMPIAYSLKAKVLVYAASPLFNGNTEQSALVNTKSKDRTPLFNQTVSIDKWKLAAEACKDAVELCEDVLGMKLYKYGGSFQYDLTDTILTQMSLRGAFTERWNSELIWANTQSVQADIQTYSTPKLDLRYQEGARLFQGLGVSMKVAEQFYSDHGIPVMEDITVNKNELYELRTATADDQLYIHKGTKTVNIHFNREPRFYAWLGFDTGVWYGQGNENDSKPEDLFYVKGLRGQVHGYRSLAFGPVTGYQPKKFIHFKNVQAEGNDNYAVNTYPWPIIRLADLYLLYAEALNEAEDTETSRELAMVYVDKVRERAGLEGVEDSWTDYSSNKTKFKSQRGLREIIQQERLIELCLEGQRFWDIRRWKTAIQSYHTPIQSWDLTQRESKYYYRKRTIASPSFGLKDYFWPIRDYEILINPNLEQNLGWKINK
ncbi:RagB/SusD family nutrient uptake outer membrane protein [Bacteroides sp.]|uniref:RagB/SusD family nutrient uptake outer membrane protein n=1 Tax=Bacteroides sp. TaxID=29523 RepID=UPI002620744E|nr:RagB/SusD family nutrient uptake outer membrane protein [Bacteroides sp.]MDD3038570.1 RagB/SusD family nutrient uptake outer membrane protein [Bacteroides sp.]